MSIEQTVDQLADAAIQNISKAPDLKDLDSVRVAYLGKKGELTALLKSLGTLDAS